jgi:glycosyltransferase involved in cell wall biosynthesis
MKVRDVIGQDARVIEGRSKRNPEITIVTPTYRRNAYGLLHDRITSALDQTFSSFEHIIIDDASNDGTEDLVRDFCKHDDATSFKVGLAGRRARHRDRRVRGGAYRNRRVALVPCRPRSEGRCHRFAKSSNGGFVAAYDKL